MRFGRIARTMVLFAGVQLTLANGAVSAPRATTTLVSVSSQGKQGSGLSASPSISNDGRYVAFGSDAANLVPGDVNGYEDIFVRDRKSGKTELSSASSSGAQGNDDSFSPSLSADGRFVVFTSYATNLVPNDTNATKDVFVHDRKTGTTTRVSVASDGAQGDDASEPTNRVASFSADDRYVVFDSFATNLVAGDTNVHADVFVHDMQTGMTSRVSLATASSQADGGDSWNEAISANGRYVAYTSEATDLVPADTNGVADVFVTDLTTSSTSRVSTSSIGFQGNDGSFGPSMSADGRYIAFSSFASNLVAGDTNGASDIFVHDQTTLTTTRASIGAGGQAWGGDSIAQSISAGGRYIALTSYATNLVSGDTNAVEDAFVRDLTTGAISRVSVATSGTQATGGDTDMVAIDADGGVVAFASWASNLVPNDTNGGTDVFTRQR